MYTSCKGYWPLAHWMVFIFFDIIWILYGYLARANELRSFVGFSHLYHLCSWQVLSWAGKNCEFWGASIVFVWLLLFKFTRAYILELEPDSGPSANGRYDISDCSGSISILVNKELLVWCVCGKFYNSNISSTSFLRWLPRAQKKTNQLSSRSQQPLYLVSTPNSFVERGYRADFQALATHLSVV